MKTIQAISLFLIALVLCSGCENDDDYTPQPLPYFYCKINGENFSRRPSLPCQSMIFNYYPNGFMNSMPGTLILVGRDCVNFKSVGLYLYGFSQSLDTLNLLGSNASDSSRVNFRYNEGATGEYIVFDSLISGHVKFDQFSDKQGDQNGIVNGTFEFTVRNEELDSTVAITEGRFQYIIDYEWY